MLMSDLTELARCLKSLPYRDLDKFAVHLAATSTETDGTPSDTRAVAHNILQFADEVLSMDGRDKCEVGETPLQEEGTTQ